MCMMLDLSVVQIKPGRFSGRVPCWNKLLPVLPVLHISCATLQPDEPHLCSETMVTPHFPWKRCEVCLFMHIGTFFWQCEPSWHNLLLGTNRWHNLARCGLRTTSLDEGGGCHCVTHFQAILFCCWFFFPSSPWINCTQWFLIRYPAASGTFWRYTLDQDLRAGSELNIQSTCPVQLKGGESEWDVNLWRSKVNSGCFPPGLQDSEIKPSDCINKQEGRRVNLVTQLLRSDALGARSHDGHPCTWTSWWCCWIEKKVLIVLFMAKSRRHKTDKFYWVKH